MTSLRPSDPEFEAAAVAVIGGGPAGLMAAEQLLAAGFTVDLYDAMPSVGRKLLLAGVGGLNLTHSEPFSQLLQRYQRPDARQWLQPALTDFAAEELRQWVAQLGVSTFVGSSGRVFPEEMKASPLLRAWLQRLLAQGLRLWPRHRWLGFAEQGRVRLRGPEGECDHSYRGVVLALGGASWPKLGSDGQWLADFQDQGLQVSPWRPSNVGFACGWSESMQCFAGKPLKVVAAAALSCPDDRLAAKRRGELIITKQGVEGGLVYALSQPLRDHLLLGQSYLALDLSPQRSLAQVQALLSEPRGKASMATFLRKRLRLDALTICLLRELLPEDQWLSPETLAKGMKHLLLPIKAAQPIAKAISSAGGLCFANLTPQFMIRSRPGVFVAGEMLDWEAPTGGYLLTACFSSGRWAGLGLAQYLSELRG